MHNNEMVKSEQYNCHNDHREISKNNSSKDGNSQSKSIYLNKNNLEYKTKY